MSLRTSTLLLFAFVLFVQACSNQIAENIERGSDYIFVPGYPEVRATAVGYIDEQDSTKINVAAEIVYGSLIYKVTEGKRQARIVVEIQYSDLNNPEVIYDGLEFPAAIVNTTESPIQYQDVFSISRDLTVPPGDYEVRLSVLDLNSGKQSIRPLRTTIPDPEDEVSHVTPIRLFSKSAEEDSPDEDYDPVTTYDVSLDADSVKFVFQVTNYYDNAPLRIQTRLLKFESDTSITRPVTFNNFGPSSKFFRGIEFDRFDVVQSTDRDIRGEGSILVEVPYENLGRGNYRFEVTTTVNENTIYKARDFGIKSTNYPSIKSTRELANPLFYLMTPEEHEDLMAIESDDSLKKAIDRFWLKNVKDPKVARNVISLYYERVEEANKQFANFKEGWKTDMGMIYILFGPPFFVDDQLDVSVWSYTYDATRTDQRFIFRSPKIKNPGFPFNHFLLQRSSIYYNAYYQQIQAWLSGGILRTNL